MKVTYFIKKRILLILIVIIFLIIGYNFAANVYNNVGYTPDQPIPFSHKIHAGDNKIDCLYCHHAAEKGPYAGIPAMENCMGCHSVVAIDKENIQQLTRIYSEGKSIEWVRVHRLPDHSYFNHKWHVNAGVECETCHGDVAGMAVIGQVNRLEMGDCIQCHRNSDYSQQYAARLKPGDKASIANNVRWYPYLKYIDSLTLKSAEAKGIEALKKDTLDVEPATGIFPHHNASVQCNICHN
ncbi:MAG TPA: cytochrome C [candidate division Zixibacteria bacterium]|nr:cytochrome C [candidate division Zixibacteria bacterium]HEQ99374.1 cytochrome C [candidate division Zixibacteria bacterium]